MLIAACGSALAPMPAPPRRAAQAPTRRARPAERGADYFQRRRNPTLTRLIGKPRGKVADTERGPVNLVGILNGRVSDERFDVSPRRLGSGHNPGSVFPASPHRQVVGLLRQRARRVTDRRSPPDVHVPRPIAEPQPERAEGDRCKDAEKEDTTRRNCSRCACNRTFDGLYDAAARNLRVGMLPEEPARQVREDSHRRAVR
jgi:hypothetical protein